MVNRCKHKILSGKRSGERCSKQGLHSGYCIIHKRQRDKHATNKTRAAEFIRGRQKKPPVKTAKPPPAPVEQPAFFEDVPTGPVGIDENIAIEDTTEGAGTVKSIMERMKEKREKRKATKEPRKVASIWMITLNSNKSVDGIDDEFVERFEDFVKILYDEKGILEFVKNRGGKSVDDVILEAPEVEAYVEVGEDKLRLHSHALLKIYHEGCLYIDMNLLRSVYAEEFGQNAYLNIKSGVDHTKMREIYIKKQQGTLLWSSNDE